VLNGLWAIAQSIDQGVRRARQSCDAHNHDAGRDRPGLANLPDGGIRFRTTDGIDLSLDVMVRGFVQQFAAKVRSLAAVTPNRFIKITTEIEQLGPLEKR
jgi:hypothetical protein